MADMGGRRKSTGHGLGHRRAVAPAWDGAAPERVLLGLKRAIKADLGARIDLAQVSALSRTLFRRQLTDIVQEILADRDTPCSRARQNQLVAELLEDIVGQARWSRASTTRTWSRCATETPSPISWSTAP